MQKDVLSEALKNQNIVSVYTNKEDSSKFLVGFVLEITNDLVLIGHITLYGKYDGYITRRIEDIHLVTQKGIYERKIEKLYSIQNQKHNYNNIGTLENLYITILNFAKANHLIITVELFKSGNDDITGFVKQINGENVIINLIDYYGQDDGLANFSINDITSISCDTDNEIALKLLYDNK